MDWLWLLLSLAGLGLLWLLIMALDKLVLRLKEHDEARKITIKSIKQRTAEAEAELLERQYLKEGAKDYIENADLSSEDPDDKATLKEAIETLSSRELVQSVAKRIFGGRRSTDGIMASQSAFDNPKKVVANGDGITPVKVKSSSKSGLSKSEQKLLKKIKRGD